MTRLSPLIVAAVLALITNGVQAASQSEVAPCPASGQGARQNNQPSGFSAQDAQDGRAASQASAVSERATFYVHGTPAHARTYEGRVAWRTDIANVGLDRRLDMIIRADVEVTEVGLALAFIIRRNTSTELSASHTIEVSFGKDACGESRVVNEIKVPFLQDDASGRGGVQLSGISARVAHNAFFVGLSSKPADIDRNIELMRTKSWIDLPLVVGNGYWNAALSVEKGQMAIRLLPPLSLRGRSEYLKRRRLCHPVRGAACRWA